MLDGEVEKIIRFVTITDVMGNLVGSQALLLNGGDWEITVNSSVWQTKEIEIETAFVTRIGMNAAHIPVSLRLNDKKVISVMIQKDRNTVLFLDDKGFIIGEAAIADTDRMAAPAVMTTFEGEGTSYVHTLSEPLELTVKIGYASKVPA